MESRLPERSGASRRQAAIGAAAALLLVAAATGLGYPLREVAPVAALGIVYLVAVLLVASLWGGRPGAATALLSAAAFNFFHLPPTGRFTIAAGENWVALAVFLAATLVASTLAERTRARTAEVEQRRGEADLAAEMARLLLRGGSLPDQLSTVSRRLAVALGLASVAIELEPVAVDERRRAFELRDGERRLATLLVAADLPDATLDRLRRVVPALEALLAAALERDALQHEVVETSALRRSDVLKTALLRAVSHDLRSPLTAILAASDALRGSTLTPAEHEQLVGDIGGEAARLSRLIDNLLDLSRLEADAAQPRTDWCSIEEVLQGAVDDLAAPPGSFALSLGPDLPQVRADPAQLERAFANLLENAVRHSGGLQVSVRARAVGERILVRIVDRGPGVAPSEADRIFEPFHRSGSQEAGYRGSGLGLAIARGLVESNGGRVWVESLPGQGASFVVELPLERVPA